MYYSAASIWEIAMKSSLRLQDFPIDLPQLLATLPEVGPGRAADNRGPREQASPAFQPFIEIRPIVC